MGLCTMALDISTISDFLVYPTGCFYYFWLLIFGFLFLFLTYSFYEKDEAKRSEGEILSSMGVSSLAITMAALWGSFVRNTQDIQMIQTDIFLWILAPTILIVALWLYNKS